MSIAGGRWGWAPLSTGFAAGTVVALGTIKVIEIARLAAAPTWMRVGLGTASVLLLVSILVLCVAAVCLIREGMEPAREAARLARRVLEANAPARTGDALRQPWARSEPEPAIDRGSRSHPMRPDGHTSPPGFVEGSRTTADPKPSLPQRFFHRQGDHDGREAEGSDAGRAQSVANRPERLIGVWHTYLESGDGRFTAEGLSRQLRAAGVDGEVVIDHCLGEAVLGVDLDDGNVYLLPHFDSTPEQLTEWFQPRSSAAMRLSRIQRLVQVAVAVRGFDGRLELRRKGAVE